MAGSIYQGGVSMGVEGVNGRVQATEGEKWPAKLCNDLSVLTKITNF